MKIRISEALINEALTPSEFRPLMKIGRELAMQRINQIWPRLEAQADSKNRSGDRLYFNLEKSEEEFEISSKDRIISYLNNANYEMVNFKDGLVRKKGDKNITSFGKVLTMLSKKDPKAKDLLNAYNNEKSVMALGDDYVMVISKHPYDIGGMSTDRSWKSCMNLRGGEHKEYVPIDIQNGTIVSYLVSSEDLNIKNPIARMSIKPFISKSNEKDVLYGIEQESVKYGLGSKSYVKKLIKVLDIAQKEKTGIFKIDEKLYSDNKNRRFIGDFSKEDIENFNLKVKEVRSRWLTIEILSKKYPWLLYADVEDAVIGGFSDVFIWHNGLWKSGWWKDGDWENGTWKDGTWEDGKWKNGVWEDGTWKGGLWENGTWKNGTWKGGEWEGGEWKGGVWEGGLWKNGTWEGGTWKSGTWKGGTWKGGTWEGGNIWNGSEYVESSQPPK